MFTLICFCDLFFCFKQKTAYEMRISDWSSYVCSSDLRHAGDVRLGGDQLEKGGHGVNRVEQAFVHVDVDYLRAVLHLLARDFDGGGIVAGHDQLLELGRSGDVGAFADIDETGARKLGGRSEEHTSELQTLMRISYAVFCL